MQSLMTYKVKLGKTSKNISAKAQKVYKRASQASIKAYKHTKTWVANIDKQSIKQYLIASWKVVRNGGGRCSTYLRDSYRLARSKKYHQSNVCFVNALSCFGLAIKACFLTCCELFMINQILRRAGLVKSTPHNLLLSVNARIDRLSANTATAAINKVRTVISKVFHRSKASNTNKRGYSFLSAGIKTRKSA